MYMDLFRELKKTIYVIIINHSKGTNSDENNKIYRGYHYYYFIVIIPNFMSQLLFIYKFVAIRI